MIAPTADFDWRDRESGDVVLSEQPSTAVYWNQNGAIVIRQERAWDEDSDTIVIIRPENAAAVAEAILALLDEPDAPVRQPKDSTAAERQRRRRQKLRGDAPLLIDGGQ